MDDLSTDDYKKLRALLDQKFKANKGRLPFYHGVVLDYTDLVGCYWILSSSGALVSNPVLLWKEVERLLIKYDTFVEFQNAEKCENKFLLMMQYAYSGKAARVEDISQLLESLSLPSIEVHPKSGTFEKGPRINPTPIQQRTKLEVCTIVPQENIRFRETMESNNRRIREYFGM
jgi:hypothetical protein